MPAVPRQQPHANPYQSPSAAMFSADASQGLGSRASMPSSVTTACWALGIAGGLSMLLLIFGLVMVAMGGLPAVPQLFYGLMAIHLVIAAADIGAVVMLHHRAPGARIVGFIAAAVSILGAVVHVICAVVAIIGLLHAETGKYLAKR
jgi:hypothetical protein